MVEEGPEEVVVFVAIMGDTKELVLFVTVDEEVIVMI